MKHRVFRAHHVEQNAKPGAVADAVGVLGPVLAAQTPILVPVFRRGKPFRFAVVFGVKEHDVDPDVGRFQAQLTGHFEQHPNARGSVVGSVDGLAGAGGVLVGKGTGVPVREKQDAVARFGMEGPDDVFHVKDGAVKSTRPTFLYGDLRAVTLKFLGQPICALGMPNSVGHTRPKRHLALDVGIGGIGAEGRSHDVLRLGRHVLACRRCRLGAARHPQGRRQHPQAQGQSLSRASRSCHPCCLVW